MKFEPPEGCLCDWDINHKAGTANIKIHPDCPLHSLKFYREEEEHD